MLKKILIIFAVLAVLIIAAVLVLWKVVGIDKISQVANIVQSNNSINLTPKNNRDFLLGVSLSPKSYEGADFTDFLTEAGQNFDVVTWAGDWNDLNKEQNAAVTLQQLSKQYSFIPVVQVGVSDGEGKLLRPLDESTQTNYTNSLEALAKNGAPLPFLGIGVEINSLAEQSPKDFAKFETLFHDAVKRVKAASPETKVFTVFQLEKMKGLNGGLFGGINNPDDAQWDLLSEFDDADAFGFTTYPGLIFTDPSKIPTDYYSEIRKHTTKPLYFTEIGWPGDLQERGFEVYKSDEKEQAEFITTFAQSVKSLKPELLVWPFLYDQNIQQPFTSAGLRTATGEKRESYDLWKNLLLR